MNRFDFRQRYVEGWYEVNGEKLVSACAEKFRFNDPRESQPIDKSGLVDYMHRWNQWTSALGATNAWNLKHEVRQDKDGLLTDWEWWELVDTSLCGMAIVQTSDAGVLFETITYFDPPYSFMVKQR